MVKNCIVYIVGPPGVGKRTIGKIVANKLNGRLVDNHYWLNPVLGVIQQDGVRPLPKHSGHLPRRAAG